MGRLRVRRFLNSLLLALDSVSGSDSGLSYKSNGWIIEEALVHMVQRARVGAEGNRTVYLESKIISKDWNPDISIR